MPRFGNYEAWLVRPHEGNARRKDDIWEEHGMEIKKNEIIVYIESQAGKEFNLRWGAFETSVASRVKVFVNGTYTTSRVHKPEAGDGWHTPLAFRKENGSFHRYTFAPLPNTPDVENAAPGSCERACTIRLEIDHVTVRRKGLGDEIVGPFSKLPPSALTTIIPVNGASRLSVQHVIALGKEHTGQPLPARKLDYVNICKPCRPEPVAIFTFICRPRVVLLKNGILRDPVWAAEEVERCKRRIEAIKAEKIENERELLSLENLQRRFKQEDNPPVLIIEPSGSSFKDPIDLTEPPGSTLERPIDLTLECS